MTTATRRPVASVSMESVVHLVDQDARTRDRLHRLMRGAGLPCRTYRDADSLLLHLDDDRPGCVLVALHTSGKAGLRIQRSLGESGFTLPVDMSLFRGDRNLRALWLFLSEGER